MSKKIWLGSLFVAGVLTVTGMSDTALANEDEGAKTVWGETLPAEADPDGDGWANTGFDPTWMPQEAQDEINELAYEKDFGDLSQVEFNESVAAIYQREMNQEDVGQPEPEEQQEDADQLEEYHEYVEDNQEYTEDHQSQVDTHDYNYEPSEHYYENMTDQYYWTKEWYHEIHPLNIEITNENMAYLAMNSPEKLNSGPLQEEPYNYHFFYNDYEFHFSFDGTYWYWSYASVNY